MESRKILTKITRGAVIAALYFLLTIVLAPISYGPLQLRLSEALTMLPMIFPEAIFGLTIGCALANVWSTFGILDIVVGSLTTLLASYLTYRIRNKYVSALPPILLNAILIPLVWLTSTTGVIVYLIDVGSILLTQALVIYVLGIPLVTTLDKVLPQENRRLLKKTKNTGK